MVAVFNFSARKQRMKKLDVYERIASNYADVSDSLRPYEFILYRVKETNDD